MKLPLPWGRFVPMCVGATCALALLLMGARVYYVLFSGAPSLAVTSGFEEESLFALWKFSHHQPVYQELHQLPYAASYFNWFFYGLYGTLLTLGYTLFEFSDPWLPTLTRGVTLALACFGAISFNSVLKAQDPYALWPVNAYWRPCLSLFLFFGPLIGFWAITTRPDLGALVFDVLSISCFFRYYASDRLRWLVASACWAYLSWSMKHLYVVVPGTIGVFLLLERQYKALLIFSMLMISAWTLTLSVASKTMLDSLFLKNSDITLSAHVFMSNLALSLVKMLPLAGIMGLGLWAGRQHVFRHPLWAHPGFRFGIIGVGFWILIFWPTSSKVGAWNNYHFSGALFFSLLAYCMIGRLESRWPKSVACCWAVSAASVCWALGGHAQISLSAQHAQHAQLKSCIEQLPKPVFVKYTFGNLPWINASPIHFVLAYNYWADRAHGVPFEHNGVGGLIDQGYFASLIIEKDTGHYFDHSALTGYRREPLGCAGFAVYQRVR